jgi:hypothetical protein
MASRRSITVRRPIGNREDSHPAAAVIGSLERARATRRTGQTAWCSDHWGKGGAKQGAFEVVVAKGGESTLHKCCGKYKKRN